MLTQSILDEALQGTKSFNDYSRRFAPELCITLPLKASGYIPSAPSRKEFIYDRGAIDSTATLVVADFASIARPLANLSS